MKTYLTDYFTNQKGYIINTSLRVREREREKKGLATAEGDEEDCHQNIPSNGLRMIPCYLHVFAMKELAYYESTKLSKKKMERISKFRFFPHLAREASWVVSR